MSVQQIVEDTPAIELQAESQYDDRETQVSEVISIILINVTEFIKLTCHIGNLRNTIDIVYPMEKL